MAATRHVAPAGSPITARDLIRWTLTWPRWNSLERELTAAIGQRFGVEHCFLVSTGRAGLSVILDVLKARSSAERTEVVIPSYTCYSVAASVVRAGLVPRVVDIDPNTLDIDRASLGRCDARRILAIIAPSLYGLPMNLRALEAFARERDIYLVDDSAQAMGATLGGRWCGTFGDVGLFSFDKGKALSAIDGGVILTRSKELADALRERLQRLARPGHVGDVEYVLKAFVYSIFLRPGLYAIPNAMPALALGVTRYETDFPIVRHSPVLTGLALSMLPHLGEFIAARVSNATRLLGELSGCEWLRSLAPLPGAGATYVRLPLLAPPGLRDNLVRQLRAAGIGASGSYPLSIADVPELRSNLPPAVEAAGGRFVAARMLTLPTHPYVSSRDIRTAVDVLRRAPLDSSAYPAAQLAVQ